MSKRITLSVVAMLAIFALVGGVAVASADHRGSEGSSGFIDRVAEILGIAPEEVSSAVAQARDEARIERMAARLAEAVGANVITQEEADAISDWFDGRPDALKTVRHHGLRTALQADEIETFLADLIEQELITQSESDEITAWLAARPATIDSFREWRSEQHRDGVHMFRRGLHRAGGFGHFKFHDDGGSSDPDVVNSDPV